MSWVRSVRSALKRGGRPALVLALTLTMTGVAIHFALSSIAQSEQARFDRAVAARERALKERLENHADTLRASSGLLAAGVDITELEFRRFFERLELQARYPGIQAFGWIPKVDIAGKRARYPVRFVEPADDRANAYLRGWNAYDSPACREAMEHARHMGHVAATGRVQLPAHDPQSRGFFMFAPVDRLDVPSGSDATPDSLKGFVFGYFRLDAVFDFEPDAPIAVRIYDGREPIAARLLFTSHPDSHQSTTGDLLAHRSFDLAGRSWTLTAWATPAFQRAPYEYVVLLVGLGGLLISVLLAGITWSEATARSGAEAAAAGLRASRKALLEADEAKNRFLTVLGHELRNPLGAVSNALHVMRTQHLQDPVAQKALDTAERQVRRQTRLVDDLLDLSRIGSGKFRLQLSLVDLNDIARHIVALLQEEAAGRGQQLRLDTPAPSVPVNGDPVRLEQVAWNLLSNAIKFTPDGGEIRLVVDREADGDGAAQAVFRVRDTGLGLTAAERASVFDMYAQAAPESTHSRGGLGVGLSLVQQIVELHQGSISALSEGRGAGAEFVVRLPLTGGEPAPRSAPPPPNEVLAAQSFEMPRRRVVVVEDDADARDMLVELLRKLGFDALAAPDGEAGVELAQRLPPGLMLVDLDLPGINGFEVARRVRALPNGGAVLLVALTGFGQPEERELALSAGFDEHMLKPLDLESLRRLLDRCSSESATLDPTSEKGAL